MPKLPVIAIDGPAGAGKSTVARRLAERLGFLYVDSGATYRAAALKVLEGGVSPDDASSVVELISRADICLAFDGFEARVLVDGRDVGSRIRESQVSTAASKVSRLPEVRHKLVVLQRSTAEDGFEGAAKGVVMEGRDIGTVVFPDAPLKIFLKADPEERARRRQRQEQQDGRAVQISQTAHDIARRDKSDSERKVSPLVPAADACEIDSTHLSMDQVVERILRLARAKKLIERDKPLPHSSPAS